MTTDFMTLDEFIAKNGITIEIEGGIEPRTLVAKKTVKDEAGWEHYAWSVTLVHGRETITSPFRTGIGLSTRKFSDYTSKWVVTPKPPSVADILDSMASDSSGWENARDFDDWASDYGYDTDSRKAHHTYEIVGDQAKRLKAFLGRELYEQLLWQVERA
jgi:hypothetical protein